MSEQKRMQILREVALQADTDAFYSKAEELGKKAAEALTDKKRSQITGLESTANSALKVTDVLDFVKIRSARHEEWRKSNWGPELLDYLKGDLRNRRETVCSELALEPQGADGITVHLLLIREFVRQLAAHYEYVCKFEEVLHAGQE